MSVPKTAEISSNRWIIIILSLITAGIIYFIVKDFFVVLFTSGIFAILTSSISEKLNQWLNSSWHRFSEAAKPRFPFITKLNLQNSSLLRNLASFTTILLTLATLIIISNFIAGIFLKDISKINFDLSSNIETLKNSQELREALVQAGFERSQVNKSIESLANNLQERVSQQDQIDISKLTESDFIQRGLSIIGQIFNLLVSKTIDLLINFTIFILAWHFMLVSGKNWVKTFYSILPFTLEEQGILNKDVRAAVNNVVLANTLSGVLNALAVFAICSWQNVPYAILLVIFAFLIGFLPLSPSEIAYVIPLSVIYFKNPQAAVLLIILCELYVLFLNYILLPKIMAGASVNPLLILLSVLAAVNFFGVMGFIIGPILVYVASSLYKIVLLREEKLKELQV